MKKLIDFYFEGGSCAEALKAIRNYYPRYSPSRRGLYRLNVANMVGLRLKPKVLNRIAPQLDQLPRLSVGETRAILFHKFEQNARVYVFDQDWAGKAHSVTKIEIGPDQNGGLRREQQVLDRLAEQDLMFLIPKVLNFSDTPETRILRMTAVPAEYRILDKSHGLPDAIFETIGALHSNNFMHELSPIDFRWFQVRRATVVTPAVRNVALAIELTARFRASAAHGDLGSENVFSHVDSNGQSRYAIIDWEFFTETAPALTDRVAFWLGARARLLKGYHSIGPQIVADHFVAEFCKYPEGIKAAVFALLYLSERGHDLARNLCGHAL